MFVQMVQHKQRPFVAEFLNHVPNRTVHVLRIYLLIYFSHKDMYDLTIYDVRFICSFRHFVKCAAKLQKFPKVTKFLREIRSKKVTLSSFFAFWGLKKIKGGFLSRFDREIHVSKLRFGNKYSDQLRGSMCCKQHSKCYPKHFFTRTNLNLQGPHWKRSEINKTKKRPSYLRNELWYSIVASCADGLMLIIQVKGPEWTCRTLKS